MDERDHRILLVDDEPQVLRILEGRLAAVADVFDAITSRRCYKPALPPEQAFDILREERGRHFDPDLLDRFLGARDEVLDIAYQYADR